MGSTASHEPKNHNYSHHVVLFPFMSKGHTIPILHLARLLLRHDTAVTLITTPSNFPFICSFLSNTNVSILQLPFPKDPIPGIPFGVESTDKLPSMTLFPYFALSTQLIQPHFEKALESLKPSVDFMITDGFLWWTLESSKKYNIPRLVFSGASNYASCVLREFAQAGLLLGPEKDNELIVVPNFPWIKVTKNDVDAGCSDPETEGHFNELAAKMIQTSYMSCGYVANSFYELESLFVDHWNGKDSNNGKEKVYCVGPLCLVDGEVEDPPREESEVPTWVKWLNGKFEQGRRVLYVAFGTQANVSLEQMKEISTGLEESGVDFLWVIRKEHEVGDGFEERVKERGVVVRDWVDQKWILNHPSVEGFLSHCGWGSVLESICAGVPILAWPMMAEQPVNARFVVEEIKVGLRVETCDGSLKGFVKWDGLKKAVKELMEDELGEQARVKVKEYSVMAKKAMEVGSGSSWKTLELLIDSMCKDVQNV